MGVSENVVYPKKTNGFADHYPVFKNGYFIGNIPNIFRQTHMGYSLGFEKMWNGAMAQLGKLICKSWRIEAHRSVSLQEGMK